jgi:hypothetical protein
VSGRSGPVAKLTALDEHGHGLVVRFYWLGDRYGHSIDAVDGSAIRPLLESLEGNSHDNWPASPPLQNISTSSVESDSEHGHVAMLVGAAGTSHWSMCVSARDRCDLSRDANLNQSELIFDVACRLKESPVWLGTSYRAIAGQVAISEKFQQAYVPVDLPACAVTCESGQLQLDTSSDAFPIIRCNASSIAVDSTPTTARWKYVLRLADT